MEESLIELDYSESIPFNEFRESLSKFKGSLSGSTISTEGAITEMRELLASYKNLKNLLGKSTMGREFIGMLDSSVRDAIKHLGAIINVIDAIPSNRDDIDRAMLQAERESSDYDEEELDPSLDETIIALENIAEHYEFFRQTFDASYLVKAYRMLEESVNLDLVANSFLSIERTLRTYIQELGLAREIS